MTQPTLTLRTKNISTLLVTVDKHLVSHIKKLFKGQATGNYAFSFHNTCTQTTGSCFTESCRLTKGCCYTKESLNFDIVFLDLSLPDNHGLRIANAFANQFPHPPLLALGFGISAEQAFHLSKLGIQAFVEQPFSSDELVKKAISLIETPANFAPQISTQVGKRSLRSVGTEVRKTMLKEALSRTLGNRTRTAELLQVSRQAVQQMIADFEIDIAQFQQQELLR